MQQHAARGFVDVLAGRYQHHSGFAQRQVDGHVVGPVAREPVYLVNNAVVHLVLCHVLDHPHQRGTVSLSGGLARVHELLNDGGPELFSFASVRIALGRDGISLFAAALLGLFLGRDAQVDHGGCSAVRYRGGNEAIDRGSVV
nr:hypothetical protein [Schaalia sp. JY-X159]